VAAELGIGTYELKGDRGYMEDRAVALRLPSGELYAAVFDGHLGEGCPEYCKNQLHHNLSSSPEFDADPKAALHHAFRATNTTFCRDHDDGSGTTAVVAMVRGNQLYCANAGDSRATICRKGRGEAVTKDHKPEDAEEKARVERAGGKVEWDRVVARDGKNMLACARSIGDSKYKVPPPEGDWSEGPICVTPDVFQITLTPDDAFLVMASDGVWDVLSDQKVCEIINKALAENPEAPQDAAKAVCVAAYQAESEDNISAAIIMFKDRAATSSQGGGKMQDPAKAAEKAEAQRKAKELAAQKKAEAAEARKQKAAETARIKREEALAAKEAEAKAAKVAAELGIGTYELKGDRGYMEDRAVALRLPSGELYAAVFDGHLGEGCPEYCKNQLHHNLSSSPEFDADPKAALHHAFRATNTTFCRDHDDGSGTTAVVAMVRGNQLYCANAGDSRATICRKGRGEAVTKDHKPEDAEEKARVERAGGKVEWDRVVARDGKNMLACARSIGDSKYKVPPPEGDWSEGPICVTPDVFQITLTPDDAFLVMASDGVWDVLSDQKVCEIINKALAENPEAPQDAAKAVCVAAYQAESEDNISAAIIMFKDRPAMEPPTHYSPLPGPSSPNIAPSTAALPSAGSPRAVVVKAVPSTPAAVKAAHAVAVKAAPAANAAGDAKAQAATPGATPGTAVPAKQLPKAEEKPPDTINVDPRNMPFAVTPSINSVSVAVPVRSTAPVPIRAPVPMSSAGPSTEPEQGDAPGTSSWANPASRRSRRGYESNSGIRQQMSPPPNAIPFEQEAPPSEVSAQHLPSANATVGMYDYYSDFATIDVLSGRVAQRVAHRVAGQVASRVASQVAERVADKVASKVAAKLAARLSSERDRSY